MIHCQSGEQGEEASADTSEGWRLMAQKTSKTMQMTPKQKQRQEGGGEGEEEEEHQRRRRGQRMSV